MHIGAVCGCAAEHGKGGLLLFFNEKLCHIVAGLKFRVGTRRDRTQKIRVVLYLRVLLIGRLSGGIDNIHFLGCRSLNGGDQVIVREQQDSPVALGGVGVDGGNLRGGGVGGGEIHREAQFVTHGAQVLLPGFRLT